MAQGKNTKEEKQDFYFTKEGFKVFTEKYHLDRGYCCKSGCRHCPYGFHTNIFTKKKSLNK
ncbi:MAG: hypothetical protein JXR10_02910 [Cyclobacteriaceae bacterium]